MRPAVGLLLFYKEKNEENENIVDILIDVKLKPSKAYTICRGLSSALYYWHLWVYTILCFISEN